MTSHERGLYISFLGIDGIGKTTLSRHLADELRKSGRKVTVVSWRDCLDADLPVWPQEALRTMWMDTFRLLFGGAQEGGKHIALPERYEEWRDSGAEESLGDLKASASSPSGPLAAVLVEFAGNLVLNSEVIRPALERGEVVVQETYPYKHVLKEYLLAVELAKQSGGEPYGLGEIEALFAPLEEFFGGGSLRPDLGVLVDGPVSLAHEWRLQQSGQVGVLEDLRTTGETGKDGFVRLQAETVGRYRAFAQKWGWCVHTVEDAPLEKNLPRGLELINSQIAALRPSWG